MQNPVVIKIIRSLDILMKNHPDYTLLDCCAWLSGFFENEIPELSHLFDYIVDKDVMKKPRSSFDL